MLSINTGSTSARRCEYILTAIFYHQMSVLDWLETVGWASTQSRPAPALSGVGVKPAWQWDRGLIAGAYPGGGGGGGRRGCCPPPIQTYTDRPKLKQLRRALVWLVSLFGGSRPLPSENPGYAPELRHRIGLIIVRAQPPPWKNLSPP